MEGFGRTDKTDVLRPKRPGEAVGLFVLTTDWARTGLEYWYSIFIFFRAVVGVAIDFKRASRRAATSTGTSKALAAG